MKRVWTLVIMILAASFFMSQLAMGANPAPKKDAPPAAKSEKPVKMGEMPQELRNIKIFRGEVVKIAEDGKSITIKEKAMGIPGKEGEKKETEKTFSITEKANVRIDAKPSDVKSMKVGDRVTVRYTVQDGQETVQNVRVMREGPGGRRFDRPTTGSLQMHPPIKDKDVKDAKDAHESKAPKAPKKSADK